MSGKGFRKFLTGGLKNKKEEEKKKDWEIVKDEPKDEDVVSAMTGFGDAELKEETPKAPIDRAEMEKEIEKMGYGDRADEPVPEFKRVRNAEELNSNEKIDYSTPHVGDYGADNIVNEVAPKSYEEPVYNEPIIKSNEVKEEPIVSEPLFKEEPKARVEHDYSNPYSLDNQDVIEHEPKSVIASGLIARSTEVSPAELGLSNNLHVQKIEFNFTDCEPIELDEIDDAEGFICSRLTKLENKYGVSVLPLDLCGIPNNVVQIKNHKIIEINGRKFASGTSRVVNNEDYAGLLSQTKNSLQRLKPLEIHLLQQKTINGFSFVAPILNEFEINQFISKCRNFKPEVYFVSNGDIVIKFGVFNAKI